MRRTRQKRITRRRHGHRHPPRARVPDRARARRVDATDVPPIDGIASIDVSRVVSRRHRVPNVEDNASSSFARDDAFDAPARVRRRERDRDGRRVERGVR